MKSSAKVVVVGGGMMGVGLLYHLAAEGWTDVLLLEKNELTSGSTWHAAGQCATFISSYNMAKIHHYGIGLYPKLQAMTGQYVSWHGCGGVRFAMTPAELDLFKHVQGYSHTIGFRMEIIGPGDIHKYNPHVNVDGVLAAALTLDDGHVDPAGACNAMAIAARNLGATIIRHNRALHIEQLPSGEWKVFTEQGDIVCEHVVNAGGCYAGEIGKWVGLQVPLTNMEHHYIVTDPIPAFQHSSTEIPVMRDPWINGYYRQEQKSGLIGIYERQGPKEAWNHRGGVPEWASSSELFSGDFDRIGFWLERAMQRMPIFAEAGIRRVVNGAIPHTPDGNPLLGPAEGLRNFWMCCGSSIGIAQGAGCGKYLAQWMVHGAAEINMREFDPRRFGHYANAAYTRAKSFEDYTHMFQLHVHGEEREAAREQRTTPLYHTLKAKGAVYTEGAGWERPKWFAPPGMTEDIGYRRGNAFAVVAKECQAVRERVGVLDLSSFAKLEVRGAGATAFLDRVLANKTPRRAGGIALSHLLSVNGRIETEFTVTRLAEDHYYLLSSAVAELRDFDFLRQAMQAGEAVEVRNVSDAFGNLVLAGPRSRALLSRLTDADLGNEAFKWLTGKEITVAGIPVRALRVNYVGELGWELHAPMQQLKDLYQAVWNAGQPLGIADFGLYAVNSLRMEKSYRGWGAELTNEITPLEAGLGRLVAFDKGDFVGREACLAVRDQGCKTQLVYLEVDSSNADLNAEVFGGDAVFAKGKVVGVSTSGGYGHTVQKSLAFAYVSPEFASPDTELEIKVFGELRKARVLADLAYDPQNLRLRA